MKVIPTIRLAGRVVRRNGRIIVLARGPAMTDDELIVRLRKVAERASMGAYTFDLPVILKDAADRIAVLTGKESER